VLNENRRAASALLSGSPCRGFAQNGTRQMAGVIVAVVWQGFPFSP